MAEQLNYNINVSGNASESVGSLKKQLREAQAEVGALSDKFGATSKEAVIAAKRAAELKDRIGDAKSLTEAFNPDAKFKALSASLSGVAGGFAAVQGAIGLFGGESKELEKQLLKVQSALALSQGLQSIGESIDSFKQLGAVIQSTTIFTKANSAANALTAATLKAVGISAETTAISFRVLKTAIVSTGIGVLVIALGELVSALMNYTSATDKAKKKQEELNEVLKNSAVEGLKAAKGFVKSQAELNALRAKSEGATEEEITKIRIKGIKDQINLNKSKYEELLKLDKKAASELADENASLQDELTKIELDGIIKRNENRKKEQEQRIKDEEEQQKKLEENAKKVYQAGLDFEKVQLETTERRRKEAEEQRLKDQEDADKFLEEELKREETRLNALTELSNKKLLKEKELQQEELKATEALQNAKFAAASAGINLLGSLVGENEKLANALFVVDKALAIAKIVVDTQKEIAGYAANPLWSALPDGGAVIKGKYILGAKLRAAASIGTIAATTVAKFKGGSASANFGQGGSINNLGTPIVPSQQTQLTQLNQQSINAIGNSAIRAYVVETDITSNQKRVQAIKQRARFS
jgi:hypothetical protein